VNHRANQPVAEGGCSKVPARIPHQSAPEPAISVFHCRAGRVGRIEKLYGDRAELNGAAQAAAVARVTFRRFPGWTLAYPTCALPIWLAFAPSERPLANSSPTVGAHQRGDVSRVISDSGASPSAPPPNQPKPREKRCRCAGVVEASQRVSLSHRPLTGQFGQRAPSSSRPSLRQASHSEHGAELESGSAGLCLPSLISRLFPSTSWISTGLSVSETPA